MPKVKATVIRGEDDLAAGIRRPVAGVAAACGLDAGRAGPSYGVLGFADQWRGEHGQAADG